MRVQTFVLNLKGRTHPLALARFIDRLEEERMAGIKQPKPLISPSLAPPGNITPPPKPPRK